MSSGPTGPTGGPGSETLSAKLLAEVLADPERTREAVAGAVIALRVLETSVPSSRGLVTPDGDDAAMVARNTLLSGLTDWQVFQQNLRRAGLRSVDWPDAKPSRGGGGA